MFGSENFPRLKFGVGDKPKEMDLADYVLGRFSKSDEVIVKDGIEKACEAVYTMVNDGYDVAMNRYNG
jgi:PTH1 family peptidyl-tRNA hydrolase